MREGGIPEEQFIVMLIPAVQLDSELNLSIHKLQGSKLNLPRRYLTLSSFTKEPTHPAIWLKVFINFRDTSSSDLHALSRTIQDYCTGNGVWKVEARCDRVEQDSR